MQNRFQTLSPVDGRAYVERPYSSDKDIETALSLAVSIQQEWQKLDIEQRAIFCRNAVNNRRTTISP